MTDHEKRIREALEAGPTEGPWFEHHDKGHLYIENQRDDVVCDMGLRAKSTPTSQFIAACNPTAIRSLLADLDGMRGASKKLVDAVNYKAAAMAGFADPEKIDFANECVWRAVDQTTRALKGASHD